jgi:hypothetical protein
LLPTIVLNRPFRLIFGGLHGKGRADSFFLSSVFSSGVNFGGGGFGFVPFGG